MEMEEINSCKRPRSGADAAKLGQKDQQHQDDDDDDGEVKMEGSRIRTWQHTTSSRIFRVSRASGGKDRHSKVLTAKGLRDRRVRLSVSTAIQFYDLQDRLGYDQPSKAVEWLIRSASTAIAKLPALEGAFPEPLSQHTGGKEKQIDAGMEVDAQDDNEQQQQQQQQQHLSLSKSGGSSTSETSKGSVLSLSRSESRIKARERARERTAKDNMDKDNRGEDCHVTAAAAHHHHSLNSQSSFTELLTGGSGNRTQPSPSGNCIQKQVRQLPQVITTADYFGQAGLFGQSQKNHHHSQSQSPSPPPGFSSQPSHFGNSSPITMVPFNIATATSGDHQEMQHFSFLQDHLIPPVTTVPPAGDYSLNFSISPGLAGYNRGTLQSNSSSQLPHHHLQRFSPSPVDGSNLPFLFGATPSPENQFSAGFDGRLQLCYGDGFKHSDLKGKGKS